MTPIFAAFLDRLADAAGEAILPFFRRHSVENKGSAAASIRSRRPTGRRERDAG